MAMADYRWCDKCGCKAFYDANLNYNFEAEKGDCVHEADYSLDFLGDWAVLCKECSKTHECIIKTKD